jgi:hypothetical protein
VTQVVINIDASFFNTLLNYTFPFATAFLAFVAGYILVHIGLEIRSDPNDRSDSFMGLFFIIVGLVIGVAVPLVIGSNF